MKELLKIKEVFLTDDIDDETREDNIRKINEWENGITINQALAEWQSHDITKRLVKLARESYKDNASILATSRKLTNEERQTLFAKQDAIIFLLSMTGDDANAEITKINKEIKVALEVN